MCLCITNVFVSYSEVITSAEFHPLHCNLLAYSSSRGFIRLADMRQSALCDHSAKMWVLDERAFSFCHLLMIFISFSALHFFSYFLSPNHYGAMFKLTISYCFYRLRDGDSRGSKSFFTEIITSISDIKFGTDGRHILSRDYMNLKVV